MCEYPERIEKEYPKRRISSEREMGWYGRMNSEDIYTGSHPPIVIGYRRFRFTSRKEAVSTRETNKTCGMRMLILK